MRGTFRAINTVLLWAILLFGTLTILADGLQGWTGLPGELISGEHWKLSELGKHLAITLPPAAILLVGNLVAIRAGMARWVRIAMGSINAVLCLLHVLRAVGDLQQGNIGHFVFILAFVGLFLFFSLALLIEWPEAPPDDSLVDSTEGYQRVDSLDLLRGIAILGIFLMNTWTMSLPQEAYTNPATYALNFVPYEGFPVKTAETARGRAQERTTYVDVQPPTGSEYYTYLGIHLFADMKFVTMFSMMFGAGILLQGQRAAARGLSPLRIHYARMAVLLLIGLIHAFGIWYGDILTMYALLGMVLFPLRRLPPGWLVGVGVILIASSTVLNLNENLHWKLGAPAGQIGPLDKMNDSSRELWKRAHLDPKVQQQPEVIDGIRILGNEEELEIYRGNWWGQMRHRAWESFRMLTVSFPAADGARCAGCILVGMALLRLRFFQGRWTRGAYVGLAALLIPVGWMITYLGVVFMKEIGWESYSETRPFLTVWGLGVEFNYWGSLITELGYISFGVLLAIWAADPARWVLRKCLIPIRAIGRMALTCYILESLIGTWIFYGHGLGYFGYLWRIQLLIVVGIVWAFLLILAPLWLHFFRQGPLEWVWHRIVYWRGEPPPLKDPAVAAVA